MTASRWLLAAAAVSLAAPVAQEEPVIRITVNLVQVDAVVTDSKGHHVTDLKPEDFEIIEDGRPQKITNFSYIRLAEPSPPTANEGPTAPPATPAPLKREDVRRSIVVVVDDLGLSFESMGGLRQDLKRFVERQIQPGDMVAIVRTSGGVGELELFTNDRRALLEAVNRLRWYPMGSSGLSAMAQPWNPWTAAALPTAANRFSQVTNSLGTLGAIGYIVNGMGEMPGRKSIILISDGLSFGPTPESDPRLVEAIRRLADRANRSAVVLYSIDAHGLQAPIPGPGTGGISATLTGIWLSQQGLEYLAQKTGGFLAPVSNRVDYSVGQILDDLRGYYLIGYKPDASRFQPRDGKQPDFHNIKVRVKERGLHVRSRSGYYGYEDKPRPAESFVSALFSPFASSGVHLRLTPVFGAPPSGPRIALLLHIDARDLEFSAEPGGLHEAAADIVAFTADERGVPVDRASYKAVIRLKPDEYEYALATGFVYTSAIRVARPGPYHVRVAVRDASTGRIGTANQFIEVPDLANRRLALSGLVVGSPAGRPRDTEAPGAPSFRVFRRGGALDFGCEILNARTDPATKQPAIDTEVRVFRDGKQVLATEPKRLAVAPGNSVGTTANGSVHLDSFEPGSYVLEFVAHDKLAKKSGNVAAQRIDFDVIR